MSAIIGRKEECLNKNDRLFSYLPLAHVYGQMATVKKYHAWFYFLSTFPYALLMALVM